MSRILLAVSGGVDSMYMLARSSELFPGSEVAVAHCNFGLRGDESDGDEEFVRGWCAAHGIRCFVRRFDTLDYASARHISVEMAARDLRYAWFAELLSGTEDEAGASGAAEALGAVAGASGAAEALGAVAGAGFDAVAVAHNADDNAETLLLNLLRGTGTRGLRGMGSRRLPGGGGRGVAGCDGRGVADGGLVLRPLLGISRAEIEAWMKSHGVPHREDSTNASDVYKRNKIRHSVFPVFAEINPSFLKTLASDMEHIAQVDDIADEWFRENAPKVAEGWPAVAGQGPVISIPSLMALPHWEYMLWRLLEPYGFDEPTLEDLKGVLLAGGTVSGKTFEAPEWKAVTGSGKIVIVRREDAEGCGSGCGVAANSGAAMTVDAPGEYSFGGCRIMVRVFDKPAGFDARQSEGTLVFDAEALPFPLKLRHWQEGDWMKPLGLGGRKKLSDLFVDLKWSLPEKAKAIVLEYPATKAGVDSAEGTGIPAGGRVGALLCCRIDDSLKVKADTRSILEIRWSATR